MSEKKYPVITISREYGAGGRSVAKGLSEKLGIPWYDNDFVKLTAEQSGFSEETIKNEGEEISGFSRALDSVLNNVTSYVSSHDAIFLAQKLAILKKKKKPCIIIGRCANSILKEAEIDSFDIFLYAEPEIRAERAKILNPDLKEDPRKLVDRIDTKRINYYKTYAKHTMGKAQNYNLCLDTGKIDYDTCVDIIVNILNK